MNITECDTMKETWMLSRKKNKQSRIVDYRTVMSDKDEGPMENRKWTTTDEKI